jgi:uncharacterized GH25 family protein
MTKHSSATISRLIILFMFGMALFAEAHDIVIVPEPNQFRIRLGHPEDWQSVDAEKSLEFQVLRGSAAPEEAQATLKRRGLDMTLATKSGSGATLAAARYDNGLWVELPAVGNAKPEYRNTSRFMLPSAKSVMISVKYAKAFAGSSADTSTFGRTVGHLLELVPQKNPLALGKDEALPVLLLFNGKPVSGEGIEVSNLVVKVAEDRIKRYVTDANGIAQVMLNHKGVNTLAVDVNRPNDGSLGEAAKELPAEKILMIATYTFVR